MFNQLPILRRAGFFERFAALSDVELVATLRQERKNFMSNIFEQEFDPGDYTHISELLAQDDKKFLNKDLEADVAAENNAYISVIEAFATLSNGAFNPINIKEFWHSETGPIEVSFKNDFGELIHFEPDYEDDWLHEKVFIVLVNELQKVTKKHFLICLGPNQEWFDQTVTYIRLNIEQKLILEDELNWYFPPQ